MPLKNAKSHILIVDDLEPNLIALEGILSPLGANIVRARSGSEALDLLLSGRFAVALIDVQMPGMDGFELAETMRGPARTRGIPIIFVTAGDRSNHRWQFRGYEAGAVDFLFKPLIPEVVRSKVGVFLSLDEKNQDLEDLVQVAERERSKAEETAAQLRAERDLRDRFVAMLSHDLRTPLTTCKLMAQMIRRHSKEDPSLARSAGRISDNIDRADKMITDLLDVSRIEGGAELAIEYEEVDLSRLLHDAVADLSTHYGNRFKLELESEIHGYWSKDGLTRIIENLGSNAVKYGHASTPITISATQVGSRVKIEVNNLGDPLPEEDLSRIFNQFHRSRSAERSGAKGWGIGLTLVQGFVSAMKGKVWVESQPDVGTTFCIDLPLDYRKAT